MSSPSTLGLALGFASICLIWGSTWLAMKEGLETVPPFTAAVLRFLLSIAILFALLYHRKERLPRTKQYWQLVSEAGLLMYGLPFALIYWGQSQIPSGLSSIMFATYPLFIVLVGRLRLENERLDVTKIFGVLLGFFGVYMIFAGELSFDRSISPWGMAAIVVSAGMQAFGLITIRKRGQDVHPIAITLGGLIFGAAFLLILSLAFESLEGAVFDATAIGSIAYLAVFGTVTTFITYFWLVKHVHPVFLSLTAFITPIVALTLGTAVRGEHISPDLVFGATLVLLGVLATNGRGILAALQKQGLFTGA